MLTWAWFKITLHSNWRTVGCSGFGLFAPGVDFFPFPGAGAIFRNSTVGVFCVPDDWLGEPFLLHFGIFRHVNELYFVGIRGQMTPKNLLRYILKWINFIADVAVISLSSYPSYFSESPVFYLNKVAPFPIFRMNGKIVELCYFSYTISLPLMRDFGGDTQF